MEQFGAEESVGFVVAVPEVDVAGFKEDLVGCRRGTWAMACSFH